ncbi:MAG: NADH-quinone oxidoreductase subunit NuoG [Pseudomonadota bacterium]|nr:NADH-quinone oxidoreductase subunit NuoG [Pseudomonadota bacterium]
MSEDLVTFEVDGLVLQAKKGAMLMEVTDAADIYIPRFCYHKKLSIAANCRMCLVEVEKAPKPLPACATPVMEGIKVYTRSPRAREAQAATMEFLLINHPLDCPICDQGGECELQDLAMGYGSDISRYVEKKRVVKDKDIGPLIQTDMTRCIHCTRCVRFGDEVAGLRELGATGRGEHLEIGTYIENAVSSEMSGNVIDLCPVGALTSKPFRYSARAWELRQKPGIAPHDAIGSNISFHIFQGRVKRVVPREHEGINEVWVSDRDRFSYEGLYSADRLLAPRIKENGSWREAEWETAFAFAAAGLKRAVASHGVEQLGALASPAATLEELYLFQKLARALGTDNIDHRLRQLDFSDDPQAPLFPWLGSTIADLERIGSALLIGSDPRKDQPIANHRLRKAAMHGGAVMVLNPIDFDFNYRIAQKLIIPPSRMVASLAGIAKALAEKPATNIAEILGGIEVTDEHREMAERLRGAGSGLVLLGNLAVSHPRWSALRALAGFIAEASGTRLGYLPEAANSAGAWLAGVLPHRRSGGRAVTVPGLSAGAMWDAGMKSFLLLGLEPELDAMRPAAALSALHGAEFVVSLSGYRTPIMDEYAHALLPIAGFAETAGTFVNAAGEWQAFEAAVSPLGEARPGWKVLRVLGNALGLSGFGFDGIEEVQTEVRGATGDATPDNRFHPMGGRWLSLAEVPVASAPANGALDLIAPVSMHRLDPLVRRAGALQRTADAGDDGLHLHPVLAQSLGLTDGARARLRQGRAVIELSVALDSSVPEGAVMLSAAREPASRLGACSGPVSLTKAAT